MLKEKFIMEWRSIENQLQMMRSMTRRLKRQTTNWTNSELKLQILSNIMINLGKTHQKP